MLFNEYMEKQLKKAVNLDENITNYGETTMCKANEPFVAAHKHTYWVNSYGFGFTGPASDGNAHVHEIIDGKVVVDGDGHTHELEKPVKTGSDAVEGIDPVRTLIDPMKGSGDI